MKLKQWFITGHLICCSVPHFHHFTQNNVKNSLDLTVAVVLRSMKSEATFKLFFTGVKKVFVVIVWVVFDSVSIYLFLLISQVCVTLPVNCVI